jgi:YqaJ-like viral recombinase domain
MMQMAIITVPITNPTQWRELRKPNVGCSEVAALFGIHEYMTGFALAARKLGKLADTVDNKVLQRGRLLEPVARNLLAEQRQDWVQIPATDYYYDRDIRFGATPDLFVRDEIARIGVVQIKTVAPSVFARKWHNPQTCQVEPPLWVALQAMCEQHLTGANFAVVACLVVDDWGLTLETVDVPYLPFLIEEARNKVAAFWEMVDRGELPDPDYGRDRGNLAKVYAKADGTELDLSADNELPEIVAQLDALQMARRTAQDGIDDAQARILHRIGAAERVRFAGGMISAPTVHRKEYTAKAVDYRRLSFKFDHAREEQVA